jgi:hypothetical protein
MSAMKDKFENLLHRIEAAAASLIGHADSTVHTVAEDVVAAVRELRGDAPALEHEAVVDAADVVKTAETQGVKPAEAEAVADTGKLAAEVGHDVEAAVTSAETKTA